MKTLYISSKPAFPKIDGGCVASANFLENLSKSVSTLKYLTIETEKHKFDLNVFPTELVKLTNPESIFIDTSIRPVEALKYLFKDKSYNVDRFYSDSFRDKIYEILASETFDLIVLDGLYTTPYLDSIRKGFNGKVVVRTHNVEFAIWQGLSKNESNPFKKRYLNKLTKDLKKYEVEALNKVDGIITLSFDDLNAFINLNITTPKLMIPLTIPVQTEEHDYSNDNLFHIGAMNWGPNIEAVNRMVRLMPEIRLKKEDCEFHIAGIESESIYTNNTANGIVVDGFVNDLNRFVSQMGILVSPIQSGSGVRVKILEMMAFGIPVITTKLGAQGLIETKAIRIANTDKEIIKAVYELTSNENKRRELGLEAKSYVNLYHNPEKVSEQLIEFIKSI